MPTREGSGDRRRLVLDGLTVTCSLLLISGQCVDLAVEVLPGSRDPRVAQLHAEHRTAGSARTRLPAPGCGTYLWARRAVISRALGRGAAGCSTSYTWATREVSQVTYPCENLQRAGLTGHPPCKTPSYLRRSRLRFVFRHGASGRGGRHYPHLMNKIAQS